MDIWFLTSEYPPDYGGGISTYIDNVSTMLANKGHNITVIVRDPHVSSIDYPLPNLRVVRFKHMIGEQYSRMGYWAALSYQYAEEVIKLIKIDGVKPDIIETQEYSAIGYYLLQKKWCKDYYLEDIPIVTHLHTPTFELARVNQSPRYKFPTYWIGQMEKFCMKAASGLITQSEFLKKQLQDFAPKKQIDVIPLPYHIDKDVNLNTERDIDLLYIGRIEYRKGVAQLLKEAKKLWDEGLLFKLKLLGGDTFFDPKNRNLGDYLKVTYQKYIDEGKLIFADSIPPDQLSIEVQKSRAVIIPSLYENYPYTCIIAMSLGVPVIVSTSGGQAEMVGEDGKNGFIFDWSITNDCSLKITEVLKRTNEELVQIGINGRKRIEYLTNIEDNYDKRLKFYDKIVKKEKDHKPTEFPISQSIVRGNNAKQVNYTKDLVSIVITYYNLGKYLPETLESALATEYSKTEIIIINDGSTDEVSKKVLKDIENRNNPKIRIINIPNGGLSNARNVGAAEAKGEFIAFLDADDVVFPQFYSKAVDILKTYDNISFVYSWVRYFDATNEMWPTFNTEFPYLMGMNMTTPLVVVKKCDFLNSGLNRIEMEYGMEDFDSWVSMCASGLSGVSIPEILVKYRVRPDSMSRQFNRKMVIYLLDKLSHGHPDLYKKFGLEIYNLIVANGPGYLWDNPTLDYPDVGYVESNSDQKGFSDYAHMKYELMRIANSKWGKRIIKFMFMLRINRFFR